MRRAEPYLFGFFLACWLAATPFTLGLLSVDGGPRLSFYALYSLAAALGWLSGNIYVYRARRLEGWLRRRALLIYFLGPPGLLFLLRGLAPLADRAAAPFVAYYAAGVFAIFFGVPLVFRPRFPRR